MSIVVEKKEKVSSPPRQRRHSAVEALISYKRPQLGARGASADLVSQISKKGEGDLLNIAKPAVNEEGQSGLKRGWTGEVGV